MEYLDKFCRTEKMPKKIVVNVVMGSDSDLPVVKEALRILDDFGIGYEPRVISAHRTPDEAAKFARLAAMKGIKVIIAAAGGAAHLAGVLAAHTILPVIGIPIETRSLKGIDSLLSTVQMPGGVPVATMAIGKAGAKNAGLLAVEILAISDGKLAKKMEKFKKEQAKKVRAKDKKIRKGA